MSDKQYCFTSYLWVSSNDEAPTFCYAFCIPLRPISEDFQAQMDLCNHPNLSWRSSENRHSHETAGISCFSSELKYSSSGRDFLSYCMVSVFLAEARECHGA